MKKLIFSVLLLLMTVIGAVAQQSLPYSYGFEDNDLSADGWTLNSCHSSTGISSDATKTGSYGFRFYYRSNPPQYLISPELTGTVNGVQVEFFYKNYSSSYAETFQVGYSTTDNSIGSFTWGAEITASDQQWTLFSENYPSNTKYVSVKLNSDDQFYLYLDDFSFTIPASCIKPSSLITSNVTHNSIDLSWTQNSSTTDWVLEYSTNSDFSGAISKNVNGTPSYSISNLNSTTTYYVRVKADCGGGDESDWSDVISFTTMAIAEEVGDGWNDNFEGATCGWQFVNGGLTNAWAWGTATNNGGAHALYISKDGGTTNEYNTNSSTMVYATKLLNFATGKYEFSYDWIANGESTYDYLRVALVPASVTLSAGTSLPTGLSSNAVPTGWIALDGGSKLNLVDTWQTAVNAVDVTAGNYYLVFAWRNDSGDGTNPPAAIDNVSITRMACAYDVTDLAVSNISTTTANLTWTAGEASQWQVAYSTSSDFAGATEQIVNTASFNMTSLTSASTYYVKVRAYCGGTDFGAWSSVLEFNTACDAITSFPWSENFDGFTMASVYTPTSRTLPVCWNYINECSSSSYMYYPTIFYNSYTDYSHSTPNSIRLYSYYYYDPQPQYLILPAMENLNTKRIELWAKGYNASSTFKVGLMSDPNDASTFVLVGQEQTLTTSYQKFTIDLTGTGNYIAIMIDAANTSRNYNGMYIDDITVMEQPSCLEPTALSKSNVAARTAVLSWTAGASETAWQICLNNEEGNPIDVNTNPYTLTGLTPETAYNVKVRAKCSESDFSEWTSNISFTTTEACPAPTALVFSDITNNYVSISWTVGSSESHWNLQYKKSSEENWSDVVEVTTNPTTHISGLDAGTTYNVRVQSDCESEGTSTAWLTGTFSTAYGIPFVEEFATTTIPANWSRYSGLLSDVMGGTAYTSTTSGWYFGNRNIWGSTHAYINVYGATNKYWLVTPTIVMDANVQLTFNVALTDYNNADPVEDLTAQDDDKFVVLISTDNGENWTILRQYDNAGSEYVYNEIPTDGVEVSIDLSSYGSDNIKIAFYTESTVNGNGDNDIHIDNVNLDYIRSCDKPTALTYSNVTARTVDLSWTNGADETAWQICLGDDETNIVDADSNPFTLTGLAPETAYRVKVRANCGGDVSAWTSNVSFTTAIACQAPTALVYTDVTNVSATVSWTQGASESLWNLKYKAATAEEWIDVIGLTEPTYTITELTGATSYNVKVQADCESEGTSGIWLQGTFSTAYGIPFLEQFGTSMPANWAQYTGLLADVMDGTALTASGYAWSFGTGNGVFDNHARVNIYGSYQRWLTTPAIVMDANVQLTFNLALTAYSGTLQSAATNGTDDKFVVLISTDNGATWTILRQYDNVGSEYVYNEIPTAGEKVTIDLSSYSTGTVIVAFYGESTVSNADNNLHIDNVRLDYIPHTITATAGENGTITPNGETEVVDGENKSFTITPDECYRIASVTVDGDVDVTDAVVAANGVYTFSNVTSAHTIAATFALNTYNITSSVVGNGTITESCVANCGENKSFAIQPQSNCYRIASVLVDGVEAINDLDENGTYLFQNVTADHTIVATFEQITYTITATVGENGTITETSTVNCGDNKEITITPANCYRIASVLVDDVDVTATVVAANGVYTFENVMSDHTIEAAFEQITYTITATAGENGTITETSTVNCGANKEITITPANCYRIASVLVDDVDVTEQVVDGVYTFENVTANHTIAATFAINTYAITTTVEGNGTISGESTANCGDNKSYIVAPANTCYRIASFTVDNVDAFNDLDENGVYAMQNITADHTLAATFEQITYTITATAGENGTITETSTVNCGANKEITITPANCYRIASVLVDDVDVTATVLEANGVYTFENVIANHNIAATFAISTYNITATAGEGGSITANDGNGNVANCGENKAFTITANEGYRIASVIVDETENVTDAVIAAEGVYTFENVTADHTIAATFERVHTISAGTGADGSITPEGIISVLDGESQTFTITPVNECFVIGQVIVDLVDVTDEVIANNGVYTFENVTENHNIVANFDAITLTITATAGEGGTITHNSDYEIIPCASNESYTIVANEGYRIVSVIVDGEFDVTNEVVANNGVYTFTNVRANHTIAATFELIPANTYTITATAGDGGTITPNGEVTVYEGDNKSFTIVANGGYRISSVMVDNETEVVAQLVDGVYNFTNVTANHTIAATFEAVPTYTLTIHYVKADNTPAADDYVGTFAEGEEYMVVSPVIDGYTADQLIVSGAMPAHDEVVNVTYNINTYTITATAGANGTITPAEATVNYGASQEFTITANEGYRIVSVIVDETENVTAQLVDGVYTFVNVTANHTIAATFEAIPTYTITATANDGGSINPAEATVVEGGNAAFTISVNEGYRIVSVIVDETEDVTAQLVDGVYTFVNVTANHTIAATFEAIPTYTITATAGEGGSINPAEVTVLEGGSAEFTISANEGYRIASVMVDETEDVTAQLVDGVYTFTDVNANHTINATFAILTYTITATAGENGTITPNGEVNVNYGATPTFSISANDGYRIMSVLVDGTEAISELVDGVYTFTNVTANHTIAATFVSESATTHTITATAGENGTITPSGAIEVVEGESKAFRIEAATGYHIASVMVDDVEAIEELVDGVYTFTNVTENHTIAASFAINTYTITATAGDNGTITPAEATVNYGASQEFTITADAGYRIASVIVDETEDVTVQLVEGVYTFVNVTANHAIHATFEAIPTYTITATANEGGSINPAEVTVVEGGNASFTITANEGFRIVSVMVDETENVTEQLVDGVYTFANVTANHTIAATFEAIPTYTITATAGEGGSINPAEVTVVEGGNAEFTITANEGYRIASVIVDATTENEANVTEQLVEGVYTFANVTANHTIAATFEAIPGPVTYTITVNAGENGTVTYNGEEVTAPVVVEEGATPEFVITPANGYAIDTLIVDNEVVELTTEELAGYTYRFAAVADNHTLSVTFVEVTSAEMLEAGSMAIYPNPNNGMFSIDFSNIEGDATYQLINASGAVVETRDINIMNGETMNFNHNLRPGAYFVRIINGDKVYVEQIVVE